MAADFADESPEPDADMLFADVYAEVNEHGRLFFGDTRESAGARASGRDGAKASARNSDVGEGESGEGQE